MICFQGQQKCCSFKSRNKRTAPHTSQLAVNHWGPVAVKLHLRIRSRSSLATEGWAGLFWDWEVIVLCWAVLLIGHHIEHWAVPGTHELCIGSAGGRVGHRGLGGEPSRPESVTEARVGSFQTRVGHRGSVGGPRIHSIILCPSSLLGLCVGWRNHKRRIIQLLPLHSNISIPLSSPV